MSVEKSFVELIESNLDSDVAQWAVRYVARNQARIGNDAAYLSKLGASIQNVANIGAAPFYLEYLLKQLSPNMNVTSFDVDPNRFSGIVDKIGIDAFAMDIEACNDDFLEAHKEDYDTVVFTEVFEHLHVDLLRTIRTLFSMLKPGGFLYLTTPNGLSLVKVFGRYFRGYTGPDVLNAWKNLEKIGHVGHVREYSVKEIESLLSHIGFVVEAVDMRQFDGKGGRVSGLYKLQKNFPRWRHNIRVVARKP